MKYILHRLADEELSEAVGYYSGISSELGIRFYLEIENLIGEICQNPERFPKAVPPCRRHFSRNFPYAVIFLVENNYFLIVAIMHMKREPRYWEDRLA